MQPQRPIATAAVDLEAEVERVFALSQTDRAADTLTELDALLPRLHEAADVDPRPLLRGVYVRAVALHWLGRREAAMAACAELASLATDHADERWLSAAMSLRAIERMGRGDQAGALQELARAHVLLDGQADQSERLDDGGDRADLVALDWALTGVAVGYADLRLYELALEVYARNEPVVAAQGDRASLVIQVLNVAELHLHWGLELVRVDEAEGNPPTRPGLEHAEACLAEVARARNFADALDQVDPRWRFDARAYEGLALAVLGRPQEALARLDEAATWQEQAFPHYRLLAEAARARALAALGRLADAADVLRRARVHLADADVPADSPFALLHAHEAARLEALHGVDAPAARVQLALALRLLAEERQRRLGAAALQLRLERLHDDNRRLLRESEEDFLTGLANRRRAERAGTELVRRAHESGEPLAAVLVDVDRFKQVNDTASHAVGDEVLRRVAMAIGATVRRGDVAARIGGDEFVLLLAGAGLEQAAALADRLHAAVRGVDWPGVAPGLPARVSVTVGVASLSAGQDLAALLDAADQALLTGKRAGGDRVGVAA
ncbi:MAG TPA: GGDEF domain-containing protein [Motilibacteraceae bacterium]|nr:GGDEF domain-containing protein [Motilibacteraceae bacterium]